MIIIAFALLLLCGYLVFRVLVRRDYQRLGRLTPLVSTLELAVWLLVVVFPYLYNPVAWWLVWFAKTPQNLAVKLTGSLLVLIGMGLAVLAMTRLGMGTTMGQKVEGLHMSGLYRFSRNPQLLGGGLAVVGIALLWPSGYALGWIVLYGVLGHWMVISEEKHLLKIHGEAYAEYYKRVPRYLNLMKKTD